MIIRRLCTSIIISLTSSRLFSTSNLIKHHLRKGNIKDALQLFDENPTSCDTASWNSIITFHIRQNQIQRAHELFDQMPVRDVVSWNAIMSGFSNAKDQRRLHQLFLQMNTTGQRPNEVTFSTLISAFSNNTTFRVLIPQLHLLVLHLGLHSNIFVGSALMRGYTHLGDKQGLCHVFDDILVKDVSTWNALIVGYMDLGFTDEAQMAFEMIHEVNVISWTTLVNGYIKNRKINQARSIFDMMTEKNVVSWTAMIKGYVQCGNYTEAIQLFILMLKSGIRPNHFTYSTLLDSCAGCSLFVLGRLIHSCILKSGLPFEVVLSTSIVDMYTKCGDINAAFCIFESMEKKNLVSWNSIIGGCARHGLAKRALCEFERMIDSGIKPDDVTYINVLSACVHGGLVEEGERHFNSMVIRYGIKADMKHYTCMVDLYGRAGEVEKAEKLVKEMPFEGDVGVWGSLLAACGSHSCYELGEYVANRLRYLAQDNASVYSMLMKLQGEKGAWSSMIEIKNRMDETHAKKHMAASWISV